MGNNLVSRFSPSQCPDTEKMQSPLLLSLLQEKIREDDAFRFVNFPQHSSVPDRINHSQRSKRESDSFLSSPLYEGAKEDIRLRAKQVGWVREDTDEPLASPSISPRSSVESRIPSPTSPQSEPIRSPPTTKDEAIRPVSALLQWPHLGSDGEKVTFDTYAHHLRHMLTLKIDESSRRTSREMHSKEHYRTSREMHSEDRHRAMSLKSTSTERSIVRDIGWDDDEPLKRHYSIRKSLDPKHSNTPNNNGNGVSWTKKLRTFGNRKYQMRNFAEEVRFDSIREAEPLTVDGQSPVSIQTQTTDDSNTVDRVLAAGPQPKPMAPKLKDRSFAVYHGMISM
ncbi:uncharacterized protein FA14DRAFT_178298 [Meira miltonrushii]|uniref:Uncharacterized protein n=1 Tax=Meira miltonrushii TaxID=1280837 RepID=A0A316VF09_9BASI|nr:uncharacterized protein FA14DRAFT_178298 [Meira miltonrushii]PWN34903.1 hypothetical protein FA14DRAFT_178298 [Meira miltonrushii]